MNGATVTVGSAPYACDDATRRIEVRDHPTLNGIDYLEVLDDDAPAGSPRQQTLLVHCFKAIPALTAANVHIAGGVRVTNIRAVWAFRAPDVPASLATAGELALFQGLADAPNVLVVRTDSSGDFSTYRLSIVGTQSAPGLTKDFDERLSVVPFSFKVDCENDFDCFAPADCPEPDVESPRIDYLAKDYASFRRLMLDRMALLVPDWQERSPADVGVTIVETFAYVGDHLSYFQDAVATEAYLGTARRRVSVRRHARLLDYPMHDGSNARAWVHLSVDADGVQVKPGDQLLTTVDAPRGAMDPAGLAASIAQGALVFEMLHGATLWQAHDEILFHTWGDERCCLPAGATGATLVDRGHALEHLAAGDVLIFEEVRGSERPGRPVDADPARRCAVRLTAVEFGEDPAETEDDGVTPLRVAEIAWHPQDALPFPLCLWTVSDEEGQAHPVSVARGNVVLADHGRSVSEDLQPVPAAGVYAPALVFSPVTQQAQVRDALGDLAAFDPSAPATAAFRLAVGDAQPAIRLLEGGALERSWEPRRDLLASDPFATEFVLEVDDDGAAHARFGDGEFGRVPPPGLEFRAAYRVGNGSGGNVGAEAIAHIVSTESAIVDVRNPLPASGGVDPEPSRLVRLYAPQAFRRQERAVTEADYAEVAARHPEVQRAAATRRWTGSWYTVFVTVDRLGGRPIDDGFRDELKAFIDRYRLAGYDLEVDEPRFVPLDILLTVCVEEGHFRSAVREALLREFGTGTLSDGRRGFFHPDNFTFGQPVYLSRVIARAMGVPGVASVDSDDTSPKPNRFRRWGRIAQGEIAAGVIEMGRLEIARLDDDPSLPENGRIDFLMQGGL